MNEKKYLKKLRWMTKKRDVHTDTNTQQLGKNDVRKRIKKMTTYAQNIVQPEKRWPLKNDDQPSHTKKIWKLQHRPKKRIPKNERKKKNKKI